MSEEILEKFESDSITFTVYGLQVEGKANTSKVTYNYSQSLQLDSILDADFWAKTI